MAEPVDNEASDLTLLLGPMFAGKTSALIDAYRKCKEMGINVLAVKPASDIRYSSDQITSHTGDAIPATVINTTDEIPNDWDVLLMDEIQFIQGAAAFCKQILSKTTGKKIIVSGLNGNFKAEPWPVVSEMLAVCSLDLCLFKAKCELCGKPAGYTARRKNGPTVEVGGGETYYPACTTCFYKKLTELGYS